MAIETEQSEATPENLQKVVASHAAEGYQVTSVNPAKQFDDEAGTEYVVFFARKVGWVAPVAEEGAPNEEPIF